MKELDCKVICAEIESQLTDGGYDLELLVGKSLSEMLVMSIYLTNDILKAHGQNLPELGVSIITTKFKCSVIIHDAMSWYKYTEPICGYENLSEDIRAILNIIQACIDRIDNVPY